MKKCTNAKPVHCPLFCYFLLIFCSVSLFEEMRSLSFQIDSSLGIHDSDALEHSGGPTGDLFHVPRCLATLGIAPPITSSDIQANILPHPVTLLARVYPYIVYTLLYALTSVSIRTPLFIFFELFFSFGLSWNSARWSRPWRLFLDRAVEKPCRRSQSKLSRRPYCKRSHWSMLRSESLQRTKQKIKKFFS